MNTESKLRKRMYSLSRPIKSRFIGQGFMSISFRLSFLKLFYDDLEEYNYEYIDNHWLHPVSMFKVEKGFENINVKWELIESYRSFDVF